MWFVPPSFVRSYCPFCDLTSPDYESRFLVPHNKLGSHSLFTRSISIRSCRELTLALIQNLIRSESSRRLLWCVACSLHNGVFFCSSLIGSQFGHLYFCLIIPRQLWLLITLEVVTVHHLGCVHCNWVEVEGAAHRLSWPCHGF